MSSKSKDAVEISSKEIQEKQLLIQLYDRYLISADTLLKKFGLSREEEFRKLKDEFSKNKEEFDKIKSKSEEVKKDPFLN